MKYEKRPITDILRSTQTVFSFKDIAMIWGESNVNAVTTGVYYYVKKGQLYRIRKGFYAKDKNYDRLELATKILTPAYVGFETVLRHEGLIFQHYDTVFVATYKSGELVADGQKYAFRKLKDSVLTNQAGLINKGNYFTASAERAYLDMLYSGNYHIDNFDGLNWEKVMELLPIYENEEMVKRVKKAYESYKKEQINNPTI